MKKLFAFVAVLLTFTLTAPDAFAKKKFGGGKNLGKTHKTAPAPADKKEVDLKNPQLMGKQQATKSSKKGLMGGLLGGLLAGGLIAALFTGFDGFENIQFMDMLLLGLLAFMIFKIIKMVMRKKVQAMHGQNHAFATAQAGQAASPSQVPPSTQWGSATGGFAASEVPFNLPAGFDMQGFLNGAREHYRILQQAWNQNDLSQIQEYVSPALYQQLVAERADLDSDPQTEVMFVDAELVRADQVANTAELSVRFSGRYRDVNAGVEEAITEVWHLERDLGQANAPWLIVGLEQN